MTDACGLLAGLLLLVRVGSFAQVTGLVSVEDSISSSADETDPMAKFGNAVTKHQFDRALHHQDLESTLLGKAVGVATHPFRLSPSSSYPSVYSTNRCLPSFGNPRKAITPVPISNFAFNAGALIHTPLCMRKKRNSYSAKGHAGALIARAAGGGSETKQTPKLSEEFIPRLKDAGIHSLTKMQRVAINAALQGHDVLVTAETGSGKTLCYALPTLARISTSDTPWQGLVLVPTFSLTAQIARVLNSLQPGSAVALNRTTEILPAAPIIVGPPAIVLQLISGSAIANKNETGGHGSSDLPLGVLNSLRVLVLDEADSLLRPLGRQASKYEKAMRKKQPMEAATLLRLLTRARGREVQMLAASAILTRPLRRELSELGDRELDVVSPQTVAGAPLEDVYADEIPDDVKYKPVPLWQIVAKRSQKSGTYVLPENMSVGIVRANRKDSMNTMRDVMRKENAVTPLIFLQPQLKLDAEIAKLRDAGFDAIPIEEAVGQQREITPPAANNDDGGYRRIFVAKPKDARGIDLHRVDLVIINYVPRAADAFLHMAGRTARFGAKGRVIILTYDEEDLEKRLRILSKNLGYTLPTYEYSIEGSDGLVE